MSIMNQVFRKNNKSFYKQLEDSGKYDLTLLGDIIKEKNSQLIVSPAGSGKTTAIVLSLLNDIDTKRVTRKETIGAIETIVADDILVSTFLKTGAEDVKETFYEQKKEYGITTNTDNIVFSTLHSEFYRVLVLMGYEINMIDDSLRYRLLLETLKEVKPRMNIRKFHIQTFETILSLYNNILDKKSFNHIDFQILEYNLKEFEQAIKIFQNKKKEHKVFDFEDLQNIIYEEIITGNKDLIKLISNRYKYIYIDEFQDTSEIQYEILKIYFKSAKKLFIIGDDDQAIYSWRGSNSDIIVNQVHKDFDLTINKLETNFRCPSFIVNAAVNVVENNKNRFEKTIGSIKPGGTIGFSHYDSYTDLIYRNTKIIKEKLNKKEEIVVLSRTRFSMIPLAVYLEYKDIEYTMGGDIVDITSSTYSKALSLYYIFEKTNYNLEENLTLIFPKSPGHATNQVQHILRANNETLFSLDRRIVKQISETKEGFGKYLYFYDNIKKLDEDKDKDLAKLVFLFNNIDDFFSEEERLLVNLILNEIKEEQTLERLKREILYIQDKLNLKSIKSKKRVEGVYLTTIHDYKGKEADNIIIFRANNTMYPSKLSTDMEEERRLFYVALTRAKKKIYINVPESFTGRSLESNITDRNMIIPYNPKQTKELVSPFVLELLGAKVFKHTTKNNKNDEEIFYSWRLPKTK